jgi:hypothetical protein
MEIVSGIQNPAMTVLGNQAAHLIDAAVQGLGLKLDEVLSVMACVVADYADGNYGPEFLTGITEVMKTRAGAPSPDRVQ